MSQFMNNTTEEYIEAVYRVLWYLKRTPRKGLLFKKNSNKNAKVYSDADWAGSQSDRRSTSSHLGEKKTASGGSQIVLK